MKRSVQVAAAIVVILLLVGVIYVADPQLLGISKGPSSQSGGANAIVSESATVSASSQGGGGQRASVSIGASVTATSQAGSATG